MTEVFLLRWEVGKAIHPDPCPDCSNGTLILQREGSRLVYRCENYPRCPGNSGAHRDTGEPYGKAVDKKGRRLRVDLHRLLHKYWEQEPLENQNSIQAEVYRIMALYMGRESFHVAYLDNAELARAMNIARNELDRYMKHHGYKEDGNEKDIQHN